MISSPMMFRKKDPLLPVCGAALAALVLLAGMASADKVVLNISVAIPMDKVLTKDLRVDLPPGIGTNEVLNLDGLDIGYDVKKDVYYVFKTLELPVKQELRFKVEFKDIWVIPDEKLDDLQKHVDGLLTKIKGLEQEKIGQELKTEVTRMLASVKTAQAENSIKAGVKTTQHIRAYESSMIEMESVKKFVGRIENLVLSAGMDPGRLEGDPKGTPLPKRDVEMRAEDYKTAVYKITLKNTSAEVRKTKLRRDLPPEITAKDVLDANGLEVRADLAPNTCSVCSNEVELAAGETKVFMVKVRDKWNVNFPRFPALRTSASNVLARVSTKAKFKSIEDLVQGAITELNSLEKEPVPTDLNDKYVAFFRQQAAKLDVIEQKIARVEAALKPIEKTSQLGFQAKPPSSKTTWLIIWIILGFLAFISLVFFFRWYGRSKAEKLTDENT